MCVSLLFDPVASLSFHLFRFFRVVHCHDSGLLLLRYFAGSTVVYFGSGDHDSRHVLSYCFYGLYFPLIHWFHLTFEKTHDSITRWALIKPFLFLSIGMICFVHLVRRWSWFNVSFSLNGGFSFVLYFIPWGLTKPLRGIHHCTVTLHTFVVCNCSLLWHFFPDMFVEDVFFLFKHGKPAIVFTLCFHHQVSIPSGELNTASCSMSRAFL